MVHPDQPIKKTSKTESESSTPLLQNAQKTPSAPRIILCEQSGVWAAAMLRAEPNIRKYWKRFFGWSAAWEAFQARPGSFLVVELWPNNLPEILDALRWIDRFAPESRLAVVADRRWAESEWFFRQAGVVHFTTSPRQVRPLVEMALRHLKRHWRPAQSLAERIWRRLPWPKAATK